MSAASERHNEAAPRLVANIVRAAGGDYVNALIILESLIAGTIAAVLPAAADEVVLGLLLDAAGKRLRDLRLKLVKPLGSA